VLKSVWPIVELHPQRRAAQLPGRLAQVCACYEVALSRDAGDFVKLMIELDAAPTKSRATRRAAVA
jgi:hypothetical protein